MADLPPWNNRRPPEPSATSTLRQMFALACRMGYEMRPIARQSDGNRPCGNAALNRTHPYHSDLRVGNSSLIIVNNGMAIINRETPNRPGPHPHRSTFTSFEPHAIIMHQIKFIPLTAGYFNQFHSPTT